MNVTKMHVHRLTVDVRCGCRAVGEFTDEWCKEPLGPTVFTACEKHAEGTGVEMVEMMLTEFLELRAKEMQPPPAPPAPPRQHRPASTQATGVEGVELADGGSVTREPIPERPSAKQGIRRVAGAGNGHRPSSVPGAHRPPRPGEQRPAPAAATPKSASTRVAAARPAQLQIDMDEVPEDVRVTRIVEELDFLGFGSDVLPDESGD